MTDVASSIHEAAAKISAPKEIERLESSISTISRDCVAVHKRAKKIILWGEGKTQPLRSDPLQIQLVFTIRDQIETLDAAMSEMDFSEPENAKNFGVLVTQKNQLLRQLQSAVDSLDKNAHKVMDLGRKVLLDMANVQLKHMALQKIADPEGGRHETQAERIQRLQRIVGKVKPEVEDD